MDFTENALNLMLGHERYQAFPTQPESFLNDIPLHSPLYPQDAYVPYDAYIDFEYTDDPFNFNGADATLSDLYVAQRAFPDTKVRTTSQFDLKDC